MARLVNSSTNQDHSVLLLLGPASPAIVYRFFALLAKHKRFTDNAFDTHDAIRGHDAYSLLASLILSHVALGGGKVAERNGRGASGLVGGQGCTMRCMLCSVRVLYRFQAVVRHGLLRVALHRTGTEEFAISTCVCVTVLDLATMSMPCDRTVCCTHTCICRGAAYLQHGHCFRQLIQQATDAARQAHHHLLRLRCWRIGGTLHKQTTIIAATGSAAGLCTMFAWQHQVSHVHPCS